MTTQRNPAHADTAPPGADEPLSGEDTGAETAPNVDGHGDSVEAVSASASASASPLSAQAEAGWAPQDDVPDGAVSDTTESYPSLRRAVDAQAGAEHGAEPQRAGGAGRHAAPARSHREPRDTDDPENLAEWVDDLVDAADETTRIAGRRTGPMPTVGADTRPAEDPGGTEGDDAPESPTHPVDEGSAPDSDDYVPPDETGKRPPETTRDELISRLDALATLVRIGGDDLAPDLIEGARELLDHAGARLRLSAEHTVVALAGGTGSGKSSLFNALCGLDFSRVGITRPTTSAAHACVWGAEGAHDLLSWLSVPQRNRHSRTSELDADDPELAGLILLDLPDHDSVRAVHTAESDRLIGAVDLLVWVLDPQKYADAAVHHRYLAEMSGYGAVMVAVLNQVDRVEPEELEELLTDLRRLLETESGVQPRVLTTSTLTGQGVAELHDLLSSTVGERRALIDRLVADLDQIVGGFQRYRATDGAPDRVPDDARKRLTTELMEAGGVAAIAESTATAHERRGRRSVDWPVGRWLGRLRRDPLRAANLDFLRADTELAGPVDAQRAELETAAGVVASEAGSGLPAPWPKRVRSAARSGVGDLSRELGAAISGTLPHSDDGPLWWRTVRVAQYVLLACAGLGLLWGAVVLASWLGGGLVGMEALNDPLFLGVAGAVVVVTLAVGWLTGVGCASLVAASAAQQRERVERQSAERVRELATEWVVTPVERELELYREYSEAVTRALAADQS